MNAASKYLILLIAVYFWWTHPIILLVVFLYRYGAVERVIIYNERQSEDEDDDAEVIVKIFVEFSQMSGKTITRRYRIKFYDCSKPCKISFCTFAFCRGRGCSRWP